MHAVTVMSRNTYNICRHCVDQRTRFVSFHRISVGPYGVKPLKSGRSKTYSRPCIEIWRGIRPPCPTACSTPVLHQVRRMIVRFCCRSHRLSWI